MIDPTMEEEMPVRPEAQPIREQDVVRTGEPIDNRAELAPVPPGPPPSPEGTDFGGLEQIAQIIQIALSREFLMRVQDQRAAQEIQRLAKSINMLLMDERVPQEDKQLALEEMLPSLVQLMEKFGPAPEGSVQGSAPQPMPMS